MKTRIGFVSNSSTSSFVIPKRFRGATPFVSAKQRSKLLKFGFKRTHRVMPDLWMTEDVEGQSLFFVAEVNEFENTAYFLIKNGILFNCLKDYGSTNVIYDGKDRIIIARNRGNGLGFSDLSDSDLVEELMIPSIEKKWAPAYLKEIKRLKEIKSCDDSED